MFDTIIRFSIKNRLLIVLLSVAAVVAGMFALRSLVIDIFPDMNRPTVTIFTECPGLAPDEVESQISYPIESAVSSGNGVFRVRSSSGIGLSLVFVEFDWKTNLKTARQDVSQRLSQVKLPSGYVATMGPETSLMGQIMAIGISADPKEVSPTELREAADRILKMRLQAIPGVSQVTVIGGATTEYQILVDPQRLREFGLTLHEVEESLQDCNSNKSGGFVSDQSREYLIRIMGRVEDPRQLEDLVIKTLPNGAHLTLGQVATVRTGAPLTMRGDAGVNGDPGVVLAIQKQPGADTLDLTQRVRAALEQTRPQLPKGINLYGEVFQQATFINRAITNVTDALVDGSIMVAIVLVLFLLNVRTTFITLLAIPMSLLVTFLVFRMMGLGINTMTLGGLAVAIGELVDDAIVGVENVFRRLRQNTESENPRPSWRVVLAASTEVRSSIVFATVLVVLVFIPLFALDGLEGQIFTPLGLAYIISILASMLVSLTLTPALCVLLLGKFRFRKMHGHGPIVRVIQWLETRVLKVARKLSVLVLVVVLGLLGWAGLEASKFGREFLPSFNEGAVTVFFNTPPGTSLEESSRMARLAELTLKEIPEIETIARRTGRAEDDEHVLQVNTSELEFELKPSNRSRAQIEEDIRTRLKAKIPGVGIGVGQPISHRIQHMLSGTQAQIAIKLVGPDLDVLRQKGEEIARVLGQQPGIEDAQTEQMRLIPQIHIRPDLENARLHGVKPGEITRHAELALRGIPVSDMLHGDHFHPFTLRLRDEDRQSVDSINELLVENSEGELIPLERVANVDLAKGPNMINRDNMQRRIVISANSSRRDLVQVVEAARAEIERQVDIPQGYHLEYEGEYASQVQAQKRLLMLGGISFLGMFFVLFIHFKSVILSMQVMINIPLAFIGAVAGVKYFGGSLLSLATLIGFITLTGIAARNGIMMITHYLHLMKNEGMDFTWEMVLRGTRERIIPVLMTAITAGLALTPLLGGAGQPGREILHPVAVVIFYGLISSTLLDLVVTPLVFWYFGRSAALRLTRRVAG